MCSICSVSLTVIHVIPSTIPLQVPTTLTSITTPAMLDANLSTIYDGLTADELEVKQYIIKTFFDPLKVKTWEGVELQQYHENLRQYESLLT